MIITGFLQSYIEYGGEWWPRMLAAARITAAISLCGFMVALLIGALLAYLRNRPSYAPRLLAQSYINLFRSVPLLAVLFLLYFGLPGIGITMSAFVAGALGLGLCFGAQMAEVFRSGLEAIHRGQREAALAIGMTPMTAFRLIMFPQLLRITAPTLVATFVALLKDSSLCALITVHELMLEGRSLATEYFLPMHIFLAIGLFYFAIAWPLSLAARLLGRRLHQKRMGAA